MKPKKTPKADVDKMSGTFIRVGMIVSLAFVILAFQWTVYERNTKSIESNLVIDEDEEIIDITKQEKKPPAPPPPPELEIVEDDEVIEDDQPEIESQDEVEEIKVELPPVIEDEEEVVEEQIFMVVEDMPSFPGGDVGRMKYLRDNIKYPEIERDNGIQGLVVVSFVVEKNGSISNVKILKGVTPNINNEAIRVVKNMPKWKPGKQRGKSVRVTINLPIRFTLN